MQPDRAYELFSAYLMQTEQFMVKRGRGGLSYYKQGVFVCHFNARPQKSRDDLGFADFRYEGPRPFVDVESAIAAIRKEARPQVQIKSHNLWCGLHFPLSELEHIAALFVSHITSKVSP